MLCKNAKQSDGWPTTRQHTATRGIRILACPCRDANAPWENWVSSRRGAQSTSITRYSRMRPTGANT